MFQLGGGAKEGNCPHVGIAGILIRNFLNETLDLFWNFDGVKISLA